ncbi:MAG: 30S ribosomal protein S17 [Candidatus Falkowbacteria bacterium]|nr:30S ribosomal protein S17 [Candidatus Falkowbacteria bacterium]
MEKNKKNTTKEVKVSNETTKIIRSKSGVVTSDKMDKTIVVKVDTVKVHPKYGKRFTRSRKYKVHDETNQFKIGDTVNFIECRPLSKDKKWRVISAK